MTEPAGPQLVPTSSHRSGATVVFGLTALIWTVWLGAIASALSEHELYVFLWCGSAVALWFLLLGELRNPARPALSVAFKWWVLTLGGPIGLAYVLYVRSNSAPNRLSIQSAQPTTSESADLAGRVAFLERRVSEWQTIVDRLQAGRAAPPSRAAAPLRPPEPELGAACALVPRGRRSPAPRRVFLPAPEHPARRAIAFLQCRV